MQPAVVLCDDGDGLAERAAAILSRNGYTDVRILAGGVVAWGAAGFELFSGVNVPSKAFGEYVEHINGTPSIAAGELEKLLREGADLVVLDSRPFDEYARVSIPTATNVPGAELVLRAREIAPSPQTTLVVNCAGRTRSIIGAQSLINAGVPNKVVALRNGTMGWSLAGFTCDSGKNRRAPAVSSKTLDWARSAAQRVAQNCGVKRIDRTTLDAWRADGERTLYVFDVRDPAEYRAGHLPGAISAPGGQLVQATDQYVGTLGARIVLVDDAEVRAAMTGSWLRQMGFADVFIFAETGTETGMRPKSQFCKTMRRRTPRSTVPGSANFFRVTPRPSSTFRSAGTISRDTFRAHGSRSGPGSRAHSKRFRSIPCWCLRRRTALLRASQWPKRLTCSVVPSAFSTAAMRHGRRPGMPYPPTLKWPTTSSINGASLMSEPATPRRQWPSIWRGRPTCFRASSGTAR